MRKLVMCLFILAVCMGQQCTPTPGTFSGDEELLWTNTNVKGVSSGPTVDTTFTLSEEHKITKVRTYHWNGGQGVSGAGTISLQSSGGATYGPYTATGTDGQDGATNAYWDCTPNVELAAGTYTIIDSDNSTWSQNSSSGNAGIAWVYGYATGTGSTGDGTALENLHKCGYVSVFVFGEHYSSTGYELSSGSLGMSCWMSFSNISGRYLTVSGTVVWDGTSFTVDWQNDDGSATLDITGEVSTDGTSISNVTAIFKYTGVADDHDEIITNSNSVPLITDRNGYWPVGSSWPDELNMLFEVTGSSVQNYITKLMAEGSDYSYTNWNSTDTETKLQIQFRPKRDDE